jgi:uncharacterized membrane protein YraQ (UPF0718 family)
VRLTGEPRQLPTWVASAAFWAVVLGVIAARRSGVIETATVATFGLVFASIVVEALPFILLGAIVSAGMAVFVPDRWFERVALLPPWLQVPGLAITGFAFPVCECGSVPVARRLIRRGVHPGAGIAFMLAAPILNPIVLSSTWVAYGGGPRAASMVAGRALLGLVVAVLSGSVLGRGTGDSVGVLRGDGKPSAAHAHGDGRLPGFAEHLAEDFLFMGRFLVLGAALSALLQTVVPQGGATQLAGNAVLAAIVMMALAFMLSLCSEADAFVAASFVAFPLSAQLAFLVLGPVADTKLAVLYSATFRRRFVVRLLAIAVPVTLVGSLVFGAVT